MYVCTYLFVCVRVRIPYVTFLPTRSVSKNMDEGVNNIGLRRYQLFLRRGEREGRREMEKKQRCDSGKMKGCYVEKKYDRGGKKR